MYGNDDGEVVIFFLFILVMNIFYFLFVEEYVFVIYIICLRNMLLRDKLRCRSYSKGRNNQAIKYVKKGEIFVGTMGRGTGRSREWVRGE